MIKVILTDIEGTTTALDFVKSQLFPYAAKHLREYVLHNVSTPAVVSVLEEVKTLVGNPHMATEGCIEVLQNWIKEDRKATPLKTLQGMIWADGYQDGELVGHVYEDAARQLKTWHAQGLQLAIFSSGSVLAQKLLFGHTAFGDLTSLFSGYYDTHIGAKKEVGAYQKIACDLHCAPAEVLFLSDIIAELDAAQAAGMHTYQLVREGCKEIADTHPTAYSFTEINI